MGLTVVLTALTLSTGCMTAAKRVLKEAKGASSKSQTFPDSSRNTYQSYKGVTVAQPTSDVSPFVSREFTAALRRELIEQLTKAEEPVFRSGEPSIQIEPKVLWFHATSGMGDLLGSDSYSVVLYTISADGKPLDRVQIVTKSAAARTGDDDLAKSNVEELVGWFEARKEGDFDDVKDSEERRKKKERKEAERRKAEEKRKKSNDD